MDLTLLTRLMAKCDQDFARIVTRILTWSAEHGQFGMDLVDWLHAQVPRTACDGCGQCCHTMSICSFEVHRVIRHLMATLPPDRLKERLRLALRLDRRLLQCGDEIRIRCAFRDDAAKVCLIHEVRPFACRFYGTLKADGTRECERVRDLESPPLVMTEQLQAGLQQRMLSNSEQYEPYLGREPLNVFPLEFWLWRAAFGVEPALRRYRELLVPLSPALAKFWRERGIAVPDPPPLDAAAAASPPAPATTPGER